MSNEKLMPLPTNKELTEKKTRTPRNYDSIESGALRLTLQERATLCGKLKASINDELEDRQTQAAEAKKIAEGL